MDIENQIANLSNPAEFTHLCNITLTAKWGLDYCQFDDDQADRGNDGYLKSKKWIFARHCFKKIFKRQQTAAILGKVRSDLKKAKTLKENGLKIEKWIFITSYRIPEPIATKIIDEGHKVELQVGFIGPAQLAVWLLDKPHLLREFSWLYIHKVGETLDQIQQSLSGKNSLITNNQGEQMIKGSSADDKKTIAAMTSVSNQNISPKVLTNTKSKKSNDYKKIFKIVSSPILDEEKIKNLKTIIYTSSDKEAVLQAVLAFDSLFKFSRYSVGDYLTLIDIGIDAARDLNLLDAEAVLLAEKGHILSTQFVLLDLEGWSRVEMTNRSGFPIITPEGKDKIVANLKQLNLEFNETFREAIDKSFKSNTPTAITRVFSLIGSSAGQRAGHFASLGVHNRALFEQRLCKSSFMYAKDVAVKTKNTEEFCYILHNFANALGSMEETDEALNVLAKAVEIAKKHNFPDEIKKAEELKKIINEPKINLSQAAL